MPVPQFSDAIVIGMLVLSTIIMLVFVIAKFRENR